MHARQAAIRDGMAAQTALVSHLRLLLVGVTLAVVLPLLWLTHRSVCGPLERAVAVAGRIAQGDLSESIEADGGDETASLLRSLQAMQEALRTLVGQVRDAKRRLGRARPTSWPAAPARWPNGVARWWRRWSPP